MKNLDIVLGPGSLKCSDMDNVQASILYEMALDCRILSRDVSEVSNIWRYMTCALHYVQHIVVIGQSSYDAAMLPTLTSDFSQRHDTKDTPITSIFSRHYKDSDGAANVLRHSWAVLPFGYVFVNADYYPCSLGGGNLFYFILTIYSGYFNLRHFFGAN